MLTSPGLLWGRWDLSAHMAEAVAAVGPLGVTACGQVKGDQQPVLGDGALIRAVRVATAMPGSHS